jgi:tetratricopeptide (TPR) repeat protein
LAVAAHVEALKERPREKVPLDWALTQINLGTSLLTLGQREVGTRRLEEALAASQEALKEVTQEHAPLIWAGTQCNLGNALFTLGKREGKTELLEAGVAATARRSKSIRRKGFPSNGLARKSTLELRLRQAAKSFQLALQVLTPENHFWLFTSATNKLSRVQESLRAARLQAF